MNCENCRHSRARHRWSAIEERVPDEATERTVSRSLLDGKEVIAYTWRCVAPCDCTLYQPPVI